MGTKPPTALPGTRLDFDRVLPIFALVFVDVLGLTVILPLLHLYAVAFGASPAQIGLVAAAFPAAQLIGVPVMGALSDRFGRKPLLLISQVTTCLSFVMLGLANSLEMIILSRVLDGLFGANLATAQAALADITTDETRAQGLGLTGAAFGLGFLFGPVISLGTLEVTDSLAIPAFTAAIYSFLSILLTLFMFRETLPRERRGTGTITGRRAGFDLFVMARMLRNRQVAILLMLIFAEQIVFFGFESLLGVFTLSRLGMLGQGNALIFIVVGVVLVTVQVRFIGKWTRRYGERRVILVALALLAAGLLMIAATPAQPHPLYRRALVEETLRQQSRTSTEAILGEFAVTLPSERGRGPFGVAWILLAVIPLAIGAGLIRPSINSLITKRVQREDYGGALGVSASFVSAAHAVAPLLSGLIFQQYGTTAPFLLSGMVMAGLCLVAAVAVRNLPSSSGTHGAPVTHPPEVGMQG